jgi:hypothetical protein
MDWLALHDEYLHVKARLEPTLMVTEELPEIVGVHASGKKVVVEHRYMQKERFVHLLL